jgi:zinc protease
VAYVSANIGELAEGLSGSASPHDLETMFQLLHLRFAPPRRDDQAFASYLTTMRGRLENQWASPPYLLSRAINEVLTKDHPWRRFLTVEDLSQIELEEAMAFYQQRFADASDFVFTIVGNVEPATLRPLVETWIASLPALHRGETWRDIGGHPPDGVHKVEVEKGIEPRGTVRIVFHGPAKWSLAEMQLLGSMLEVLRIRLREELREDRGGVYGVGVSGNLWRHPTEEYNVVISFNADPERIDELVKAVFDEIDKMKKDGPAEDYVNRVQEMQRRSREIAVKQNAFWTFHLEYLATNGLDFSEINRHDERIASVTRESMRDAARRYLDNSRYVIGVLKPEK